MLVPQLQQWSEQLCCWGWVGLLPAASLGVLLWLARLLVEHSAFFPCLGSYKPAGDDCQAVSLWRWGNGPA